MRKANQAATLAQDGSRSDSSQSIALPTLTIELAKVLSNAIIEGHLTPGQRLIESELAARFGVSKSPIREAFRLLQQEGLVTSYPRRGVVVTEINRRDLEELYAIRACLCALQVQLAARNISDAESEHLDRVFEAMREAAARGDIKGYFASNMAFHDTLSELADNKKLAQMLRGIEKQTLRFRFLSLTVPERLQQSLKQHEQVLAALKQRNAAAATKAMTALIEETKRAIVSRYLST